MSSFRFFPPDGTFSPVFQKTDIIMEDSKHHYAKIFLTVMIFSITSFFLKIKIFPLFAWFWQKFRVKKNIPEECFQKDIVEIRKATDQVVEDWIGMKKFISQIQNEQSNFICRLQSLFEAKSEIVEQDISSALEEVFKRNDQTFQEMRQTIETMQEDIQSMKIFLQTSISNPSRDLNGKADDENDASEKKNGDCIEYDTSILIATVKKSLTDLLKDAKLHLSVDHEEENRELEIILTKLAEDREDIKKTILEAFSIAAAQAKKNYEQFGQIGEEAFKYMAVLNDNTNKFLKLKLDETDNVLKNTLNVVKRQTLDIDAVRKILGNVDGQFGELFEKLSQIYQMNIDHCEAITLSLERTSDNWIQTVSKIEKMSKQICDDTKHVKQIFTEIKDLADIPQKRDAANSEEKSKNKIMQHDPIDNITIQEQQILPQKQENSIFVYSCWERMRSISCNVEDGCHSISKLICGLEQKLGSLNESIEKLDNFIRGLNLEILSERAASMNYNDTAEIVHGIMQTNQGNAGDGHSQVLHNITSKMRNDTLASKIQNAIAIDNAIKLTETILGKVDGKRNCQVSENSMQSKPDNAFATCEESQFIPTADKERAARNSMEPQIHKAEIEIKQKKSQ